MDANIRSFLVFGYFQGSRNSNVEFDLSGIDPGRYVDIREDELIGIGIDKLKGSIRKRMVGNKDIVLPLSGGLDSRAILACLHEFRGGEGIECYTYGLPGSFDYEIAKDISGKLGIKHVVFPLSKYKFSIEEELEVAERFRDQTLLFFHPPMRKLEGMVGDKVIWSGFLGGEIGGSHVRANPSTDIETAKENFIRKNTYNDADRYLESDGREFHDLLELKWNDNDRLFMDDQLDFLNRQRKYIAPHVLMKGFNYVTPLFNSEFYDFMLSLPLKYRFRKYLYKKILVKAYPDLFSIGVKENVGLKPDASIFSIYGMGIRERIMKKVQGASRWDKRVNYFDVNEEIRTNSSLRKIVKRTVEDLDGRELGLRSDPDRILKDHLNRKIDAGGMLLTMSSLEIIHEHSNIF